MKGEVAPFNQNGLSLERQQLIDKLHSEQPNIIKNMMPYLDWRKIKLKLAIAPTGNALSANSERQALKAAQ